MAREQGRPNLALADFIAPHGVDDYIGGFVVTAGIGEEQHIKAFEAAKDDYSAILLRALADRLAEAFAERMHEKVRKDYWGYAAEEQLTNERPDRRRHIAASVRRRAIPPSPSTAKRPPCSSCWTRKTRSASS